MRKWNILREIVYVLQIPFRATVQVQRHDLTLSDVYGIWTTMKIHLRACANKSNFRTSLASNLLSAAESRQKVVFANPFMSCCLFLDPRFRRQISEEEREKAKEMLYKLWKRINQGEKEQKKDDSASSDISFEFDPEKEFANFLA